VRQNGHNIFQFPDHTIWVTPSTPSDYRSWANNLADLKRRLGLTKTNLGDANFPKPRSLRKPVPQKSDRTVWREWLADADVTPLRGVSV